MVKKTSSLLSSGKWQLILLCLVGFVLYANTLKHEFALDDGLMILENKLTKQGFSGIGAILFSDQFTGIAGESGSQIYSGSRYRPLSQVVFAIEYQLFGLDSSKMHFINILFYLLLAVVMFNMLKRLMQNSTGKWLQQLPFAATLLFILHPIHTEVVANIKSLDEILTMILSLASLSFAIRYVDTQKQINLLYLFLSLFAALLAKENSITFFAIIPLSIWFFRKLDSKQLLRIMASVSLALVAYFVMRYASLGYIMNSAESDNLFHNAFINVDGLTKYAMILYSWGKYISLLIFPHPLTHDYYPYQIPEVGFANPLVILSILLMVLLVFVALRKLKEKHLVSFGILFYFITFSVVSNLVFNLGLLMNERLIFMPSFGFVLVLAYAFVNYLFPYLQKKRQLKLYWSVIIVVIALYSFKTIDRNQDWKNDRTLYYADVETSVNSARCNVVAGSLMVIEGKESGSINERNELFSKAIPLLKRGLELHADNPPGWMILGEIFWYLEDFKRSYNFYLETFKYDPTHQTAKDNILVIINDEIKNRNFPEAHRMIEGLRNYFPNDESLHMLHVDAYLQAGDFNAAQIMLNDRLKALGENAMVYNKLAELHGRFLNDLPRAKEYSLKAFSIDGTDLNVMENLGVICGLLGEHEESIGYLLKVYEQRPKDQNLLNNIISTYQLMGNVERANYFINQSNR